MASIFGKNNGYTRVERSPDRQSGSDDPMLIDVEVAEDQATFDFRVNGDPASVSAPPAGIAEPGTSTAIDFNQDAGTISNMEGYSNTQDMAPFTHRLHKQFSFGDSQANVETEESLKCIVSSFLFLAIVVVLIVVAFRFNPPV